MDLFWKLRRIDNDGNILSFEITDTKNLLVSKKFLATNNILFTEGLLFAGKGEDCRLGLDLQQANVTGKYSSEMKVLHKDTQNWKEYYKKLLIETWAYQENVSAIQQEVVKKNNVQLTKIPFGHFFNKYCDEFEVRGVRKLLLLLHISFSWLIIKNFRWFA